MSTQAMEFKGFRALVRGAVLALVVYLIPFTRFIFSYLNVLVHELGHTVAGFAFGYPSVPAFDWRYGGGVTMHRDRTILLVFVVYAVLAFVLYATREYPRPRNITIAVLVLYSFAAWTSLHEMIMIGMGHTMELIIAGVFVYRAIAGVAITQAAERPLYAACGIFIVLHNVALGWGLMTDADARAAYGAAKGGGHWMDLSQIARDYLGVGVPAVAFLLLAASLATPWLAYLAHRHETAWKDALMGD